MERSGVCFGDSRLHPSKPHSFRFVNIVCDWTGRFVRNRGIKIILSKS